MDDTASSEATTQVDAWTNDTPRTSGRRVMVVAGYIVPSSGHIDLLRIARRHRPPGKHE
jgi:hypothetical protein